MREMRPARNRLSRSFRHVKADLLNEFLNWDSKFFTTIGLLLVRAWKLTNKFLAGICPPPSLFLNAHKIQVDSDNSRGRTGDLPDVGRLLECNTKAFLQEMRCPFVGQYCMGSLPSRRWPFPAFSTGLLAKWLA